MIGPPAMLLSPNLNQEQLLQVFCDVLSPVNQVHLSEAQRIHGRLSERLYTLSGNQKVLDSAIRAVTLASIGRENATRSLTEIGRMYYGNALRSLNTVLKDRGRALSDETLTPTILLSFYEMMASSNDVPFIKHAGGCGALIRLRGPAQHRTGLGREILLSYRPTLIIEAIESCTACFLDEPEWRNLFREIQEDMRKTGTTGPNINFFDRAEMFFVGLARVPEIFREIRCLPMTLGTAEIDRATAITDVTTRALLWRSNFDGVFGSLGEALTEMGAAPVAVYSGDPVFQIAHIYVNIFVASVYTTYWMMCMMLNVLLREFQSPEQRILADQENEEFATECCRSVFNMEKSSFIAPLFLIFALRISLRVLPGLRERNWATKKMLELAESKFEIASTMPPRHVVVTSTPPTWQTEEEYLASGS